MTLRRLCGLTYGLLIDAADEGRRADLDMTLAGTPSDLSFLADIFGAEVVG